MSLLLYENQLPHLHTILSWFFSITIMRSLLLSKPSSSAGKCNAIYYVGGRCKEHFIEQSMTLWWALQNFTQLSCKVNFKSIDFSIDWQCCLRWSIHANICFGSILQYLEYSVEKVLIVFKKCFKHPLGGFNKVHGSHLEHLCQFWEFTFRFICYAW